MRGKRQIRVKRKKWRSRGKVWVGREREKNEKKKDQEFGCMWAGKAATLHMPF